MEAERDGGELVFHGWFLEENAGFSAPNISILPFEAEVTFVSATGRLLMLLKRASRCS
jgi:hypothetical protein